jgi:hypothetical protein
LGVTYTFVKIFLKESVHQLLGGKDSSFPGFDNLARCYYYIARLHQDVEKAGTGRKYGLESAILSQEKRILGYA